MTVYALEDIVGDYSAKDTEELAAAQDDYEFTAGAWLPYEIPPAVSDAVKELVEERLLGYHFLGGGKDCRAFVNEDAGKVLKVYASWTPEAKERLKSDEDTLRVNSLKDLYRHAPPFELEHMEEELANNFALSTAASMRDTLARHCVDVPRFYGHITLAYNDDIALHIAVQEYTPQHGGRMQMWNDDAVVDGKRLRVERDGKEVGIFDSLRSEGVYLDTGTTNNFMVRSDRSLRTAGFGYAAPETTVVPENPANHEFTMTYVDWFNASNEVTQRARCEVIGTGELAPDEFKSLISS